MNARKEKIQGDREDERQKGNFFFKYIGERGGGEGRERGEGKERGSETCGQPGRDLVLIPEHVRVRSEGVVSGKSVSHLRPGPTQGCTFPPLPLLPLPPLSPSLCPPHPLSQFLPHFCPFLVFCACGNIDCAHFLIRLVGGVGWGGEGADGRGVADLGRGGKGEGGAGAAGEWRQVVERALLAHAMP
jgi:hypothetical protein